MSQFVNDRDIFLESQGNLNLDPRGGRVLLLTVDPVVFHVGAGGVGSPALATFKATGINIGGSITWVASDSVILRGSGPDERTVSFVEMGAETATVYISMEYQGEVYEAQATISKLYDGSAITTYTWIRYGTSAAGANFSDSPAGATYIGLAYNKLTALESENPAEYQWVLIKGEDGIGVPGAPGADGQTLWTWIKYSDNADGTGLYDLPTDSTVYIGIAANRFSAVESTDKADYIWSRFKGGQGVPGSPGAPGAATFTWIKYASSSTGAALSDSPDGKAYIGFAYNKPTPVESNDPTLYQWALLRGEDGVGVPGAPGADGITLYTWIKYADAADGTGLYDTPNDNSIYIGISVNRTTPVESTVKTDYVWSRFKGAAGIPGEPGAPGGTGVRGNVNLSGETTGNAWSDALAAAVIAAAGFGVPRAKDVITLYNPATDFVATRIFNGAGWEPHAKSFDGSILVNGTVFTMALAAEAVTTDKLAASAITAGKIAADAITAEKIGANAVTARTIAANAVTASSLAIGNADNVVPDSNMLDPVWWARPAGAFQTYPDSIWNSVRVISLGAADGYVSSATPMFPVERGGTYRFEFQVFISSDFQGQCALVCHLPGQAFFAMGAPNQGYAMPNNASIPTQFDANSAKGISYWHADGTIASAEATGGNSGKAQFILITNVQVGYIQFGGVKVTRVMDSTLLGPGSVFTKHLDLATGGHIDLGTTGFDAGNGIWIEGPGNGHGARMFLGNSAGAKMLVDPNNGVMGLYNFNIVNPQLSAKTITGLYSIVGMNQLPNNTKQFLGSFTASMTNASGGVHYVWSAARSNGTITLVPNGASCAVYGEAPTNGRCQGTVSCTGTDGVGFSASSDAAIDVGFGSGVAT